MGLGSKCWVISHSHGSEQLTVGARAERKPTCFLLVLKTQKVEIPLPPGSTSCELSSTIEIVKLSQDLFGGSPSHLLSPFLLVALSDLILYLFPYCYVGRKIKGATPHSSCLCAQFFPSYTRSPGLREIKRWGNSRHKG